MSGGPKPTFLLHGWLKHAITWHRNVWENYISRLSDSTRDFEQMMEALQIRERKRIIPPKFVIRRVIDEMQGLSTKTC